MITNQNKYSKKKETFHLVNLNYSVYFKGLMKAYLIYNNLHIFEV